MIRSIDLVLCSPPYARQLKHTKTSIDKQKDALLTKCKNYSATTGRINSHLRMIIGYSSKPDNIGNMEYD